MKEFKEGIVSLAEKYYKKDNEWDLAHTLAEVVFGFVNEMSESDKLNFCRIISAECVKATHGKYPEGYEGLTVQ